MFFSILGRNIKLALYELRIVGIRSFSLWGNNVCFFDVEEVAKSKLKKLAGQVKIGKVYKRDEIFKEEFLKRLFGGDKKLVGSNDRELLVYLKNKGFVKRFKVLRDIRKSDYEIKTKGVEIIKFSDFLFGIPNRWQPIQVYEEIDFGKPVRSMKIGMMPAKLTHYLLNISTLLEDDKVIYDPFCGSGTTLFVSNWLFYDVFGSDINVSPSKQNFKWWQNTKSYNSNKKVYIFKQDITEIDITKKKFLYSVTNVVSEGYLGPVMTEYLNIDKAERLEVKIGEIYYNAVVNLLKLPCLDNIVFVFPVYFLKNGKEYFFRRTYNKICRLGVNLEELPEFYRREGQKIGRQIIRIFK